MSEATITTADGTTVIPAPEAAKASSAPDAPAATENAEAPKEGAGEQPAPTDEAKPDQPAQKPPKTFSQEELERIVLKERAKAERRASREAYDRAMADAEQKFRQPPAQSQPDTRSPHSPADGEPSPQGFADYAAYVKALTAWQIGEALKQTRQKEQEHRVAAQASQQAQEVMAKLAPGAEKYEDFEEVALREDLPVTQNMAATILDLGAPGHDVLYFLGSNPKEAARIAALPAPQQVREIDKLAAKLTEPAKPTTAPQPVSPLAGTATVEKKLEELGYDDYVKTRRRQRAQR